MLEASLFVERGVVLELRVAGGDALPQLAALLAAGALAQRSLDVAQRRLGERRLDRVAILDRQRYDGSFSMWSANGEAQQWLTPYAVEALIRARAAGATVPEGALREALRFLDDAIEDTSADNPESRAAQAYRLYALALAGQPRLGAARRLFEQLGDLPTQIARAQLAATFARGGDTVRAEQAFAAALTATGRRFWSFDYGTAARDALATASLLRESGVLADRVNAAMAVLPGADFTPARSRPCRLIASGSGGGLTQPAGSARSRRTRRARRVSARRW